MNDVRMSVLEISVVQTSMVPKTGPAVVLVPIC